MEILAQRLQARAKQLGISNAEAGRRAGLEERRYAHYAAGRREPDMATFLKIAAALSTTPNWLLGIDGTYGEHKEIAAWIDRFANAASQMSATEIEMLIVQAEAVAARSQRP